MVMRRIKKGDQVEVICGEDRGRRGTVHRVVPQAELVVISGINLIKKHQRPRPTGGRTQAQAGIIEFEAPICLSNVMLVCPQCDQRTRVAFESLEGGGKVRVCKKCKAILD